MSADWKPVQLFMYWHLSKYSQSVNLKGNYSSDVSLTCDIPKGQLIGPYLFTLFSVIHLTSVSTA